MKFTHRVVGPRKRVGNGFIPTDAQTRLDPSTKREGHRRPLVATLPPQALPRTLEGILKKILHEIADGV